MNQSDQIDKIANSLIKFQAEMKDVAHNADSHFGKYANMEAVINAVKPLLAKHDMGFVQSTVQDEKHLSVLTRLYHASGQWIENSTPLPAANLKIFGQCSAITIGRRYGLRQILGLADSDDDGQKAQDEGRADLPDAPESAKYITDAQIRRFSMACIERTIPEPDKQKLVKATGADSITEVAAVKFNALMRAVREWHPAN